MTDVFYEYREKFVIKYLDDILVTLPKHLGINSMKGEKLYAFWYYFARVVFLTTQQLYFQHTLRLYIIHGTDTIMTQYDTSRIKVPFGLFDVCIWVSHFLVQDSPIEGTPHQCPFRGIFAEPRNYAITTTKCTIIIKASHYSPLDSHSNWTLMKASLQYPLVVASHNPHIILIFSPTFEEHLHHLKTVLELLRRHKVYGKQSKGAF
jgi:hypothetical protein